ncbi:hypothetical protein Hanom_Chr07g00593521 [Helianthus anomalus]
MGACEMASWVWPLRARHVTLLARHVTLLARPTPGFKPKPQGHAQTQAPGMVTWAFSPNPRLISHSLILSINTSISYGFIKPIVIHN